MLVLSQAEVDRLLDVDQLLDALERAFVELSAGRASVPPRIAAFSEHGLLGAMPGYVDGVLAAKLVTLFPDHEPSHQALIAVFDAETGTPTAVMDGTHITAVRTGAARRWPRARSRATTRGCSTILGARRPGPLAPRRRAAAYATSRRCGSRAGTPSTPTRLPRRPARPRSTSFEEAVAGADVVCACTQRGRARPAARLARSGYARHVGRQRRWTGRSSIARRSRRGCSVIESRVAFQPPPAGSHELQGLDPGAAVELGEVLAGTQPGRTSPRRSRSTSRWATRSRTRPRRPLCSSAPRQEVDEHAVSDHPACSGACDPRSASCARVRP